MIPFIQNRKNPCMLLEVRTVAILNGRERGLITGREPKGNFRQGAGNISFLVLVPVCENSLSFRLICVLFYMYK